MKISELAKQTGVPKDTIHYYFREGLIPKPREKARNIEDYNKGHVERIRLKYGFDPEHMRRYTEMFR
jgi:DNA-binding transcriptional MerR regulator